MGKKSEPDDDLDNAIWEILRDLDIPLPQRPILAKRIKLLAIRQAGKAKAQVTLSMVRKELQEAGIK